jgi:hypothetical protein
MIGVGAICLLLSVGFGVASIWGWLKYGDWHWPPWTIGGTFGIDAKTLAPAADKDQNEAQGEEYPAGTVRRHRLDDLLDIQHIAGCHGPKPRAGTSSFTTRMTRLMFRSIG